MKVAVCTCGGITADVPYAQHSRHGWSIAQKVVRDLVLPERPGASLQGASKEPGSNVMVGGRCVRASRRRVWASVLSTFLELVLGCACGAGLLYLYEYRFRKSTVNAALYHELSMDTGF